MVIYMEACESGSMFDNILPNNINGTLRRTFETGILVGNKTSYFIFQSLCHNRCKR